MKALFGRSQPMPRRVAIIGLDGTPYTFMQHLLQQGGMPHFSRLVAQGTLIPMTSVLPTVSCVAWTSIMTGKNPGKHGIYGFVERQANSYGIYVNTSAHVRAPTLWDLVGQAGQRAIVLNVPNTYPPKPLNGILVAGFETPDLRKGVYPASQVERLQNLQYRIDIDAWAARESKDKLLADLHQTFERRTATFLHLLQEEPWDLFIGVYMETDRLHHFLWEHMERGDPVYGAAFLEFYRKIDAALGEIVRRLDERTVLIVLSDHGFCTLKHGLFVNRWLEEQGWLRFAKESPQSLEDIAPDAQAYSLDPGRIYLNLRGREPAGFLAPERYAEAREALAGQLTGVRDPETNEPVITRVFRREELYTGPAVTQAPDLVLLTRDGCEAKGAVNKKTLFGRDEIEGMHTTDNAMLFVRGAALAGDTAQVVDVTPTVLSLLGLPVPGDVDGRDLGGH